MDLFSTIFTWKVLVKPERLHVNTTNLVYLRLFYNTSKDFLYRWVIRYYLP